MTPKRCSQLHILAERLCDVAIEEANPDLWPGSGKKPDELTKQERGDRVWAKKNAAATLNLVIDISRLIGIERTGEGALVDAPNPSDEELERMIKDAEAEVRRFYKGDKAN